MWTDDPVRDADDYAAYLDEELERRPVCCECGFHIDTEYGYRIGERWYCQKCMEDFREWFC